MVLQAIRVPTMDQAVLAELGRFVGAQGLAPGDRLPAERQIADQLGVSRSSVREALKRWEGLGVIVIRKGAGIFLNQPIGQNSVHFPVNLSTAAHDGLLHALEIRKLLETEAAALCAERASAEDLRAIEIALEINENAYRSSEHGNAEEDWAFHLSVLRACGNPLFVQMIEGMRPLFHRIWENPLQMSDFGAASWPYHRVMFEAIARKDAATARQAALMLVTSVEDDVKRSRELER
jgi:GntR family transcriptional regulator, transcriptional repressor for pyruvate dehydrogenase complex